MNKKRFKMNVGTLKLIMGASGSGKTTESVKSALNNGGGDILIVTDDMSIHHTIDMFEDDVLNHRGEIVIVDSNFCTEDSDKNRSFNTIIIDETCGSENINKYMPNHYTPHCIITQQINRCGDMAEMKIIEYRW